MSAGSDPQAAPSGVYTFLPVDAVVYGPGTLDRLGGLTQQLGIERGLLVTTPSVRATPLVARIRSQLRGALAGISSDVRQHAPGDAVRAVATAIEDNRVDGVVSLGGGSVIDTVKGAILEVQRRGGGYLPHMAVPTTLSAAEFSPFFGTTNERTREKVSKTDPHVTPRAVILDAEVARFTPPWLWLGSGIRAVDHAVETIYAPEAQPVTDALALDALRRLFRWLPVSSDPQSVVARQHCQIAAWMSFFGAQNVSLGLSHMIGRQIGPRFNLAHGFTSSIVLPHVLRRLQDRTAEQQEAMAAAVGAENFADALEALIRQLNLPTRLRDVGVSEADLDAMSGSDTETLAVLRAAW